jgi:hypothetical protein
MYNYFVQRLVVDNKNKLWQGVFSSCSVIQIESEINKKGGITGTLFK